MRQPKAGASWRDSARSSKLWIFDASATFPLIVLLFHVSWNMFFITLGFIVFLSILSYYGFTIRVFIRYTRSLVAGKRKIAVPWWLA